MSSPPCKYNLVRLAGFTALMLAISLCGIPAIGQSASCALDIESLRNSPLFTQLPAHDQKTILHALDDDIAEMSEVDVAASGQSHKQYRDYFTNHLHYREITGGSPDGKLLLLRYDSNTLCGPNDNCPVWIVDAGRSATRSLIGWRPGFGTSAEGSWGAATPFHSKPLFPDLFFLTYLSRYQVGVSCYRKGEKDYAKIDCPPACASELKKLSRPRDPYKP